MRKVKYCKNCKYCVDTDEPPSCKLNMKDGIIQEATKARSPKGICGPDGLLFQKKDEKSFLSKLFRR